MRDRREQSVFGKQRPVLTGDREDGTVRVQRGFRDAVAKTSVPDDGDLTVSGHAGYGHHTDRRSVGKRLVQFGTGLDLRHAARGNAEKFQQRVVPSQRVNVHQERTRSFQKVTRSTELYEWESYK